MAFSTGREQLLEEIDDLKRRIHELRRRVRGSAAPAGSLPPGDLRLLLCRAGGDAVALLQDEVERVVMMARLAPLPDAPPFAPGLLNLHGSAVPVVDLVARRERRARPPDASEFIVVCRHAGGRLGLVVQEVQDVFTGPRELLQELPEGLPYGPFVLGLVHLEGAQVFVYSVAQLAADLDLPEDDET